MRKTETAAELIARLNTDPVFMARQKAQDEESQRKEQEYARAESPLVQDLRAAGVSVDSVWDFVSGKIEPTRYALALPILADHLDRPYLDAIRDGIARALSVPAAKFAWPVLVRHYKEEQASRVRQGLAVALSGVADDSTLHELISLARDARLGESRALLLLALERSRLPEARKALMELGGDPELYKEAQRILRRLNRTVRRKAAPE